MRRELEEAAEAVHSELGGNWSESIYHRALERELSERGIPFHSEGTIPVIYKGAPVGRRRPDLFIVPEDDATIVVELKAGSSSGGDQLLQYLDMVEDDSNLGYIRGGAVIRFNEGLEMEFVELGPEPNPDDTDISLEKLTKLPTGVIVYAASSGQFSAQISYNPVTEDAEVSNKEKHDSAGDAGLDAFCERAVDVVIERNS
jgi:GxxExxY protein